MRLTVMNVGRVKSCLVQDPWWSWCPVCPTAYGFRTYHTHPEALSAALTHVDEFHTAKVHVIEFIERPA